MHGQSIVLSELFYNHLKKKHARLVFTEKFTIKDKNILVSPLVQPPLIKPLPAMDFKGLVCLLVLSVSTTNGQITNSFIH